MTKPASGWKRASKLGYQTACEVDLFFSRTHKSLEQGINRSVFRLGCAPAVNLFPHTIDHLDMQPLQNEYPLVGDPAFPRAYEIYSIEEVSDRDPASNITTVYSPFYSVDHDLAPAAPAVHWYAARTACSPLRRKRHSVPMAVSRVPRSLRPIGLDALEDCDDPGECAIQAGDVLQRRR